MDNEDDIHTWCIEHLPDMYDNGMFDSEDISDTVWENVLNAVDSLVDDNEDSIELYTILPDAADVWFREHHAHYLSTLTPVSVDSLCLQHQTPQHSLEWYLQRRNRLTASEFSHIFDGRRKALMLKKVRTDVEEIHSSTVGISQENGDMLATTWGHRFEPIVRRIYELENVGSTVCDTLGRFTHATIPWLSASPDGLIVSGPYQGRLVEIKAPKTREPGEFVPEDYYIQMQIQMEVTDMESVEFLEATFCQRHVSALTPEDRAAICAARWKGEIRVRDWQYTYSAPTTILSVGDLTIDETCVEHSVWWLSGYFPRTVLRNREWWQTVGKPHAEQFWTDVGIARLVHVEDDLSSKTNTVEIEWMGR